MRGGARLRTDEEEDGLDGVTRESVKPLLELQRVDSSIDRLVHRRSDLPEQRELDLLGERRAGVAEQHAEKGTALDAIVREQMKLENDVGLIDQKLKHERDRLYGGEISNPKELTTIQAELDALERRKAHMEDQILDLLEQREELEGVVGGLRRMLDEMDAEVAETTGRRDAATVEIDRELTELRARRAELAPTLPAEILETYEDIRARKGGVAVGALEEGTCRACGLPLSPAALDEIRRSEDPLPRCENCRRLLVVL